MSDSLVRSSVPMSKQVDMLSHHTPRSKPPSTPSPSKCARASDASPGSLTANSRKLLALGSTSSMPSIAVTAYYVASVAEATLSASLSSP